MEPLRRKRSSYTSPAMLFLSSDRLAITLLIINLEDSWEKYDKLKLKRSQQNWALRLNSDDILPKQTPRSAMDLTKKLLLIKQLLIKLQLRRQFIKN